MEWVECNVSGIGEQMVHGACVMWERAKIFSNGEDL